MLYEFIYIYIYIYIYIKIFKIDSTSFLTNLKYHQERIKTLFSSDVSTGVFYELFYQL